MLVPEVLWHLLLAHVRILIHLTHHLSLLELLLWILLVLLYHLGEVLSHVDTDLLHVHWLIQNLAWLKDCML